MTRAQTAGGTATGGERASLSSWSATASPCGLPRGLVKASSQHGDSLLGKSGAKGELLREVSRIHTAFSNLAVEVTQHHFRCTGCVGAVTVPAHIHKEGPWTLPLDVSVARFWKAHKTANVVAIFIQYSLL